MELLTVLAEFAGRYKKNELLYLDTIKDVPDEERFFLSYMSLNEFFSIHEWFNHQDLVKTKQYFYKCGRMLEFLTKKYNSNMLSYSLHEIGLLLLSDNKNLIARFADFRYQKTPTQYEFFDDVERGYVTLPYAIQCIVKEDWSEYERILPILTTKYLKRNAASFKIDVAFVQALVAGDKSKMELCLKDLLADKIHKKRNLREVNNQLISHPAVGYAKLAWLKGIEVEVNSPLVPKEWLPVQPLKEEEYIDYDFVKTYLG